MIHLRLACVETGIALGLAVLAMAGGARAQTAAIQLTEASIMRDNAFRDQSQNPLWISRADCLADDVFHFPLFVTNYSGFAFEVWAGGASDDCTGVASRAAATAVCWQVQTGSPTSNTMIVDVQVRDIVGKHVPSMSSITGPGVGTVDDCLRYDGTTAPIDVSIYFMFINPSDQTNAGGVEWKTKYDLFGPAPPDLLSLGIGSNSFKLAWNQSTDTDLAGYRFFCDQGSNVIPLEASTPSSNDGEAGAGATDAAQLPPNGCPTTYLYGDQVPPPELECGSTYGPMVTSGRIGGLTNYEMYSIGVAGVDSVGNVGPLSPIECAAPIRFVYEPDRVTGSGGACSISGRIGHAAGFGALGLMWLSGVAALIRGRRRHIRRRRRGQA